MTTRLLLATMCLFTGLAAEAEAAVGIPESHTNTIILLVGGVAAVAGAITWVDHRIRLALDDHTRAEQALDNARHDVVLEKIAALHKVMERL